MTSHPPRVLLTLELGTLDSHETPEISGIHCLIEKETDCAGERETG